MGKVGYGKPKESTVKEIQGGGMGGIQGLLLRPCVASAGVCLQAICEASTPLPHIPTPLQHSGRECGCGATASENPSSLAIVLGQAPSQLADVIGLNPDVLFSLRIKKDHQRGGVTVLQWSRPVLGNSLFWKLAVPDCFLSEKLDHPPAAPAKPLSVARDQVQVMSRSHA
ncbi:hypothetical protein CSUB01_03044 [Colletotrichum sublineola]|uniref:Uncharacterized protein n=1 Tax=Colletotrichum sublineola TaxID=1173701 RepID=A0A066XFM3_COLSU|nr:hypothetical protein CSUB01_03044 [Colletotrichum sublineola]